MDRRRFLLAAAATGIAAAVGLHELTDASHPTLATDSGDTAAGMASSRPGKPPKPVRRTSVRAFRPGHAGLTPTPTTSPPSKQPTHRTPAVRAPYGVIDGLPPGPPRLALTVDDGVDSDVVAAYIAFARRTGFRLTFFPNGVYPAWTDNAPALRPLVESGQIQLGNHTWRHPNLTAISDSAIAYQLHRNEQFIHATYGVSTMPFYRPPYGYYTAHTTQLIASLGWHTTCMWYGTLGDDQNIPATTIAANAHRWIAANRIIIGHANHPTTITALPQLERIIRTSTLRTVTLRDVYQPG